MSKNVALSERLNKNMEQAAALSTLIYCVGKAAMCVESGKDHDTAALAMLELGDIAANLYGELEDRMNEAQILESNAMQEV